MYLLYIFKVETQLNMIFYHLNL